MCKVSVLVPIYNVERYLRQCLDSVVNQTLKDIEIICINDGSTDSSPDIIREYAEKDSRIRVIDKENTGYGHSMNCGLKLAQGEYIGIVESDDFAELNMFETLYNTAKEVDAEIVKSNWFKQIGNEAIPVKRNHNSYGQIFSPRIQNPNIFYGGIAIWSAIYKRIFLQKNNIYFNETPGASYQDVSFFFKTLACSENIVLTKDAFIHYRCDNPSSSVKSKEKVNCIFDEFKEIERFLQNRTDIKNTCEYIVEQFKYGCYLFNYNRIDDVFKFEFFERMANEFMQDRANGYIDKRYWSEDNWKYIQLILNNKKEFFYKKYEQTQNKFLYINGFFSTIEVFGKIYVYGAGLVASSVLRNLIQRKIGVTGILVSNINNNPSKFMGLSVRSLKDTNIDKESDLILIAMKEENQYDILYQLKSNGYRNVIIITRNLATALNG